MQDLWTNLGFYSQEALWERLGFTAQRQRKFNRDTAPEQLLIRDAVTGATLLFRASYVPLLVPIPVEWVHDGWIALLLASMAEIQPLAALPMTLTTGFILSSRSGANRQR